MAPDRRSGGWVAGALLVVLALYVGLAVLQPSGEGWGRGWNMIAFLLFASPAAIVAGGVATWRTFKAVGSARWWGFLCAVTGFAFPVVCAVVIKAKA